jgi:hypothetical protein
VMKVQGGLSEIFFYKYFVKNLVIILKVLTRVNIVHPPHINKVILLSSSFFFSFFFFFFLILRVMLETILIFYPYTIMLT